MIICKSRAARQTIIVLSNLEGGVVLVRLDADILQRERCADLHLRTRVGDARKAVGDINLLKF